MSPQGGQLVSVVGRTVPAPRVLILIPEPVNTLGSWQREIKVANQLPLREIIPDMQVGLV